MDKKIANNVIVGIVVIIGFVAFTFVLFTVGGGSFTSSNYTLYAMFNNVMGLHYGSEVSLAGLRIGVVKNISVSKDDPKALVIELQVEKKMQERIREDSTALIQTQGVLGDKYIEIAIGSMDKPIVQPGSFLKAALKEDIFTKSGTLMDEVKRHFEKDSDLDTLLRNMSTLSANLAVLTTDARREKGLIHEMIYGTSGAKVSGATTHLNEILRKIDEGEGSLGALINDPSVYEDVKAMMGGAKRSNVLKYFMRSFIESGAAGEKNSSSESDAPPPKKK